MIRRVELRYHTKLTCLRRIVSCRFEDAGCQIKFPLQDRRIHEFMFCQYCQERDTILEEVRYNKGWRVVLCLNDLKAHFIKDN